VTDRDNGDDPIFRWRCNYCGSEYDSDDGYHSESTTDINVFRDRGKSDPEVHMNKIKICKYEDGQLLGYRPSCGYVHGQILKAHISFGQNYKDYNSTVNVPSPRNTNLRTSHIMAPNSSLDIESLLKEFELSLDEEDAASSISTEESAASTSISKESDISDIDNADKQYDSQTENSNVASRSNSIIESAAESSSEITGNNGTSENDDHLQNVAEENITPDTGDDNSQNENSQENETEMTDDSTEGLAEEKSEID